MPPAYHSQGMPQYWTGETWFQIARPEEFTIPGSRYRWTWVLGRKARVCKTERPPDELPEVWAHYTSDKERAAKYKEWIEVNHVLEGFNLTDKLMQELFSDLDPHKKGNLTETDWDNAFGKQKNPFF